MKNIINQNHDDAIISIYTMPEFNILASIFDRIDFLAKYFLGKPYITNPQGEGAQAEFDSAPLYRFDGFDCVTYVNNILALALSHDLQSFQKNLLKINYYHSIPKYENRFHFMSVDWNPQNQKNKILRDITTAICDEKNKSIATFAEGDIDRPNWFLKKSENETHERAAYLQHAAATVKKEFIRLPYLPLNKLFDHQKNPCEFLFHQIPHGCIIEIVRPNWNLSEKIGTNLHVSHVGFAIRKPSGELLFRHASSEQKCVTEVLLSDYLKNALENPTIKGINVQIIM